MSPDEAASVISRTIMGRISSQTVVSAAASKCIEEIANIWADMMLAYYTSDRLVPYIDKDGTACDKVDLESLKGSLIRAKVEVGEATSYSASTAVSILDKLLDGGYISAKEYVEHLPSGFVLDRDILAKEGGDNDGGNDD